jgi:hypothetical protein
MEEQILHCSIHSLWRATLKKVKNWKSKVKQAIIVKLRQISCQFLPPGDSIFLRYVLQLLFSEKSQNCQNSTTTEGREKISKNLESSEF